MQGQGNRVLSVKVERDFPLHNRPAWDRACCRCANGVACPRGFNIHAADHHAALRNRVNFIVSAAQWREDERAAFETTCVANRGD